MLNVKITTIATANKYTNNVRYAHILLLQQTQRHTDQQRCTPNDVRLCMYT